MDEKCSVQGNGDKILDLPLSICAFSAIGWSLFPSRDIHMPCRVHPLPRELHKFHCTTIPFFFCNLTSWLILIDLISLAESEYLPQGIIWQDLTTCVCYQNAVLTRLIFFLRLLNSLAWKRGKRTKPTWFSWRETEC